MKKILLLLLLAGTWFAQAVPAPETWNSEQFLAVVRNPPERKTWAKMKGSISHIREGAQKLDAALSLSILFAPGRTLAQLRLEEKEIYDIGQSYGKDPKTTVERKFSGEPRIAVFGVTPEDLTMSFIYWKFVKELPKETFRGQDCRTFLLEHPDGKEFCTVTILLEYFFPVRAVWSRKKSDGTMEKLRTLEVSGFQKENDFWVVKKLNLAGNNWNSVIRFRETSAGSYQVGNIPRDLFIQ